MSFTPSPISKLILTNDFEESVKSLKENKNAQDRLYIYPSDNILIDDVKNIIKHAYIISSHDEYITICINSISHQAQNALLKILEENPDNKYFILLAKTKNIFLPTILSRIIVVNTIKISQESIKISFNISDMSLQDIFKFIKENKNISKQDALNTIEAIFNQVYNHSLSLPRGELERFHTSTKLLHLNSKPIHILSSLFLKLHEHNSSLISNASIQTR